MMKYDEVYFVCMTQIDFKLVLDENTKHIFALTEWNTERGLEYKYLCICPDGEMLHI